MPPPATATRYISPVRRTIDHNGPSPARSLSPMKDKRASLIISAYSQHPASTQVSSTVLGGPLGQLVPENDAEVDTEADIMTALAAQERRVLELKEGLQKAEDELQRLKRQWANHESTKRRNEGRRMHQMRPLSFNSPKTVIGNDDVDGSSAWMYEEMERRKALLGNTKTSHRRVFSGSRETKTLSLLSPEKPQNEPASREALEDADERRPRVLIKQTAPPLRSSTTPDLSWQTSEYHVEHGVLERPDSQSPHRSPHRDAIVRTGKQVATDLREGFWTFFEDLRQAAVGDEVRSAQDISSETQRTNNSARAAPRRTSPGRRNGKLESENAEPIDAGGFFWRENGLSEPTTVSRPPVMKPAKMRTPQKTALDNRKLEGSPWDTWDSPNDTINIQSPSRSASSVSASHQDAGRSPGSLFGSSPDTSVTSSANATPRPLAGAEHLQAQEQKQREAIPWPALTKLTPGQLVRTASNLMEEWERSLTPSPSVAQQDDGAEDARVSGALEGHLH